ncbi:tetratricopeptide repeat protein [Fusibacter sp. JL216-2]|uniref:tetratricopeptide repeat protein n=1 Tax=Fusibacter sp. JL216-2 TaxID=3071453 RepID=UPI003D334AEE
MKKILTVILFVILMVSTITYADTYSDTLVINSDTDNASEADISILDLQLIGYDATLNAISSGSIILDSENGEAQFYLGYLKYFENTDSRVAFEWLLESHEHGNIMGTYFLGRCYYSGYGVLKDEEKAIQLIEEAKTHLIGHVNSGDPIILNALGYIYKYGVTVEKDELKAFKYFNEANSMGLDSAARYLGFAYFDGKGVSQDKKKAVEIWENSSDSQCKYLAGLSYLQGLGVSVDTDKGVTLIKKSSSMGYAWAHKQLAWMYDHGEYLDQSDYNTKRYTEKTKDALIKDVSLADLTPFTINNEGPEEKIYSRMNVRAWKATQTDNLNNTYLDGLSITHNGGSGYWGASAYQSRLYILDGKYDLLSGVIATNSTSQNAVDDNNWAYVEFWCDGILKYRSKTFKGGIKPDMFMVSLAGAEELEIRIFVDGVDFGILEANFYY